jgi:hypothetical protein
VAAFGDEHCCAICLAFVMLYVPPSGGPFEGHINVSIACAMLCAAHVHVLCGHGQLAMLPLLVQRQSSAAAAIGPA